MIVIDPANQISSLRVNTAGELLVAGASPTPTGASPTLTDAQLRAAPLSVSDVPDRFLTGAAAQTAVINNILEPVAGAAGTDVLDRRSASCQVVSTAAGGTFVFEQSNDGVQWSALPVFNVALVTAVPIVTAITATAGSTLYTFPVCTRFVRLRIASTLTGGSIQAFTRLSANVSDLRMIAALTGTNLPIVGQGGEDGVIIGNAVRVGGRIRIAHPTSFTSNDAVDHTLTTAAQLLVKQGGVTEASWNSSIALSTTTATALIAAAGAGLKRHITGLQAINTGASVVDLIILDGATERFRLPLPINVPVVLNFEATHLITTAATALNVNLSAAGTVRVNGQGYTAP